MKRTRKRPKKYRVNVEKQARNRSSILEKATELFAERGYSTVTIDDICTALNVTKPFVYYYFRSKAEIYDTVNRESVIVTLSALRAGAVGATWPERLENGLRAFLETHLRLFKAGSLYYREPQALSPSVRDEIHSLARQFHQDLTALLLEGVEGGFLPQQDVRLSALAIGGIANFMYTWYRPDGHFEPQQMIEKLLEVFKRTIGLEPLARPATAKSAKPLPRLGGPALQITDQPPSTTKI